MSIATKNTVSHHHLDVNVPNHWQVVPLENILSGIVGGGTPSRSKASYWEGTIPWLTVKDMRTRRPSDAIDHISEKAVIESATNIIPPDTLIIATRVGLGKIIRVPFEAAINQDLKALITKPEVDRSYLEYWFMCITDYLGSIGSGTTVKGIRLEQLRSLPVPLAPLEDQKKIVAEIEKQFFRLDEAVTSLKRAKANLKRYKAAVLKAAVEGKLTEGWRRQHADVEPVSECLKRDNFKDSAPVDADELSKIPDTWAWGTIQQIAYVQLGKMLDKKKHRVGIKRPYLRNINVQWRNIDTSDLFEMIFKEDELEKYSIAEGDVLVCEGGEPGRAAVWNGGVQEIGYQKALHRVRIFGEYLPELLVSYLEFLASIGSLERWFTGSTIKHFTRERFMKLPIPIPPAAEQREIALAVDTSLTLIENQNKQFENQILRTHRMRQSILKKAFSGSLVDVNSMGE